MSQPEERDERIDALEADVAALRSRLGRAEQDAAAARILAGGADRDVGELAASSASSAVRCATSAIRTTAC